MLKSNVNLYVPKATIELSSNFSVCKHPKNISW